MKIHRTQFLAVILFASRIGAQEFDPARGGAAVTVEVDRSKPVWSVKVTNHSEQKIGYEMLRKVPRGLGLEVWDTDDKHGGLRIHAEDLASVLNVDGFPADLREIPPGKSQVFQLNPRSMSASNAVTLAEWERLKRIGYYDCRVFFGSFASPLLSVTPPGKLEKEGRRDESEPAWLSDIIKESTEEARAGARLRRKLDEQGQSLVHWNRGTDEKGEYYIEYSTCAKVDLDKMAAWDGSKPLETGIHDLVTRARKIAGGDHAEFRFNSMMIEPCEDDPSKRYIALYFDGEGDDITVELLLNGSPLKKTRLRVTKEQYEEISEFRIPLLLESSTRPESK